MRVLLLDGVHWLGARVQHHPRGGADHHVHDPQLLGHVRRAQPVQQQAAHGPEDQAAREHHVRLVHHTGACPGRPVLLVNVSAKDLGTGKEQHITISSSSNMSKEDIDRAVKDAEQFAEQDKKRREEVDTKNNAENLCYTAEKLVSDSGDKMQDSDKNEINTKVAALRETLKNGTVDQIKAGMDDLQKAVYAASEKLYQQQAPQGGQPGQQPPYQGGNPGDNGGNNGGDGNVYDADYKEVD